MNEEADRPDDGQVAPEQREASQAATERPATPGNVRDVRGRAPRVEAEAAPEYAADVEVDSDADGEDEGSGQGMAGEGGDEGRSHRKGRKRRRRGRGDDAEAAGGGAPHERPSLDPELVAKRAWKIYLGEVSEEGLALINDNTAREMARRSFRLAEIFLEEQARHA